MPRQRLYLVYAWISVGCLILNGDADANLLLRAVWFKIKEEGRSGTSNTWGDTPLMKAGGYASYTIPKCLKPGYYLIRHEIIALHAAYTYPGAQFYPGCHQLKVTGSGTTTPTDLVSFPGAYKSTDAGITYDAYKGLWRSSWWWPLLTA